MEDFIRRQVIAPAYQQLPPDELTVRAAAGDAEAFVALVCLKHGLVEGVCRKVLSAGQPVEDVIQEVFVQLWRQRDRIRTPRALDRWLSQTARNLAMKVVQRAQRDRNGRQRLAQEQETNGGGHAQPPDRAAM